MSNAKRVSGYDEIDRQEICYWPDNNGSWFLYLPGCGLGNLANHKVVEHEDGTITVSPSILVTGGENRVSRHGFLERGVWRDA